MTKWLIEGGGRISLDILNQQMNNVLSACNIDNVESPIVLVEDLENLNEDLEDINMANIIDLINNSNQWILIDILDQWIADNYPWCDTPDIVLWNGQVWAACNVGATKAGAGVESYGSFFQWGRNTPFASTGSVKTITWPLSLDEADSIDAIILGRNDQDWLIPPNSNLWGWRGTSATGTYQSQDIENQILMQGPCADGYHVPTYEEWKNMVDFLQDSKSFISTMKMPLAGWRMTVSDGAPLVGQGNKGYLLSSSTTSDSTMQPRIISFSDWSINPSDYAGSKQGLSVRCLKN
jgi:hypothetical protein